MSNLYYLYSSTRMAIWHFWSGKDTPIMERQVMNILTTGYGCSGMERNKRDLQEMCRRKINAFG